MSAIEKSMMDFIRDRRDRDAYFEIVNYTPVFGRLGEGTRMRYCESIPVENEERKELEMENKSYVEACRGLYG